MTNSVSADEMIKKMGFDKCEWGPEPEDECEQCDRKNIQMYYSGGSDGIYLCSDCIVKMYNENEADQMRIEELENAGHSSHCAARQVWGDGECECDMYKDGYNPHAWFKSIIQNKQETKP